MRHKDVRIQIVIFLEGKLGSNRSFPSTSFPGGNSEREPPDPISNSEVKTFSADGSVGSPHVRVGHRQDLFMKGRTRIPGAAFFYGPAAVPVATGYGLFLCP